MEAFHYNSKSILERSYLNVPTKPEERVDRPTWGVRLGLFLLFLGCGLAMLPANWLSPILQPLYWIGFCVLFLLIALWLSRHARFSQFWEVFYAFFVFMVGIVLSSDVVIDPLFEAFHIQDTTLLGITLGRLVYMLVVVLSILMLTAVVGRDWPSLYLQKGNLKLGLGIGFISFVGMWALIILGIASGNYPTELFYAENLTLERVLPWIPWITGSVLFIGIREELWFRGLFLKKYEPYLGTKTSNLLQAIIFTLAHIGVTYTPALGGFLLVTFAVGLIYGYLMQKTDSLIASVMFHATMDITLIIGVVSTTL
jgi:membrane protease YdiL (CAAX protease family)